MGSGVPRDGLEGLVRSQGLSRFADEIIALARDSIRLLAEPTTEHELPIGVSKIGGLPDLPPGYPWPRWGDEPMCFIAQIRLDDAARYTIEQALPTSGLLSFFYDGYAWGFDPADRGAWQVVYFGGDLSHLVRTEAPTDLPVDDRFVPCAVRFVVEPTLPDLWTPLIDRLPFSDEERSAYGELLEKLAESQQRTENDTVHRMLGYPDQIQQGDMQLECQLASHGVYCGDASGYQDPRRHELEQGADDWLLLLQVDSYDVPDETEEHHGMCWDDAGRIYYWIPRDSLVRRAFEDVWLILQCY